MERADVMGAVARGWCHPNTEDREMDAELALAITDEMLSLIAAGLESAWGLIANARDWGIEDKQAEEWRVAAERWRDTVWHPLLDAAAKVEA